VVCFTVFANGGENWAFAAEKTLKIGWKGPKTGRESKHNSRESSNSDRQSKHVG
jgi:hypothetical protein